MRITNKLSLGLTRPIPERERPDAEVSHTPLRAKRLREEFPFLASPTCPMELKALVTDRISAYHEYAKAYSELHTAASPEECAAVARRIVNAYIDNRRMWEELNYYQEHKRILGHHPIFRQFSNLKILRSMNIKDLIRREERVKKNIWRVQSEIKKGDKPQLEMARKDKIRGYQAELAEIKRLLGEDGE